MSETKAKAAIDAPCWIFLAILIAAGPLPQLRADLTSMDLTCSERSLEHHERPAQQASSETEDPADQDEDGPWSSPLSNRFQIACEVVLQSVPEDFVDSASERDSALARVLALVGQRQYLKDTSAPKHPNFPPRANLRRPASDHPLLV